MNDSSNIPNALSLPINGGSGGITNEKPEFLPSQLSAFITRSVREEIMKSNELPAFCMHFYPIAIRVHFTRVEFTP